MDAAAAAAFAAAHGPQLDAVGFPRALYDTLRQKLTHEARARVRQHCSARAWAWRRTQN
jgi:hypothetical protein